MFPLPRLKLPRFALPRLSAPAFAKPALTCHGSCNRPATWLPALAIPDTSAAVDRFSVLVLRKPETVLPTFETPDTSSPRFV
ncbi:hypothetical protein LAUMK4_05803 [Mycobacterium persicum]|uniref:Secreted protein n=1 Tax=Mycobacterium persicum TaxID=1487726 RepID=A0AB38V1F7_9MYCO|nr:hypothetical protein LAUMK15_05673 [Mycobacterium persicum]VAZ86727.1 hypothetical protein LAUMK42_05580 [Mycobacterium persicum]VBA32767.1 hypothetical protein LAUMK4_05803 [Mycobacterium persicum]